MTFCTNGYATFYITDTAIKMKCNLTYYRYYRCAQVVDTVHLDKPKWCRLHCQLTCH